MITSKEKIANGKQYIYYSGRHDELRDMLKEGDLATLLMQNEDNTESIKISGVVKHKSEYTVAICACGSIKVLNVNSEYGYMVTSIKRPVGNMLPDAPGPWFDKDDATWIVNEDLNAICVSCDGDWLIGGGIMLPSEYAEYAPFKKINIIKEKVPNEQA